MDLKNKNSTSEKWAGNGLRDRVNVAKTWTKVENLLVYDSLVSQVLKLAADLTRMIIM